MIGSLDLALLPDKIMVFKEVLSWIFMDQIWRREQVIPAQENEQLQYTHTSLTRAFDSPIRTCIEQKAC